MRDSNPSVLRFLCGEPHSMSFPSSCSLPALPSWIAGSCAVLRHCPASPLPPESGTPRRERQPAKHHRGRSSRTGQPGHCRERQCIAGLKFSPHVANANLAIYAQIFPEVRPLAFCSAGPSMVASLAQPSRSSWILCFMFFFPLPCRSMEQLSPLAPAATLPGLSQPSLPRERAPAFSPATKRAPQTSILSASKSRFLC